MRGHAMPYTAKPCVSIVPTMSTSVSCWTLERTSVSLVTLPARCVVPGVQCNKTVSALSAVRKKPCRPCCLCRRSSSQGAVKSEQGANQWCRCPQKWQCLGRVRCVSIQSRVSRVVSAVSAGFCRVGSVVLWLTVGASCRV